MRQSYMEIKYRIHVHESTVQKKRRKYFCRSFRSLKQWKNMKIFFRATIWLHVNEKKIFFKMVKDFLHGLHSSQTAKITEHQISVDAMKLSLYMEYYFLSQKYNLKIPDCIKRSLCFSAMHDPYIFQTNSIEFMSSKIIQDLYIM